MQRYEIVVHFNDGSSYDWTGEADTPLHAIELALRTPEVFRHAYAVTYIEVA